MSSKGFIKKECVFVLILAFACLFSSISYAWSVENPCPYCGSEEEFCETCSWCGGGYTCEDMSCKCDDPTEYCQECHNELWACTCFQQGVYGWCDKCNQYISESTHECQEEICDWCYSVFSECTCDTCEQCGEKGSKCECQRCPECKSIIIINNTPATCSSQGEINHTCSSEACDYSFIKAIPKKSCEMIHNKDWHCGQFERCKSCGRQGAEGPHYMIHDSEWNCTVRESCKYCAKEGKLGPHPTKRERMRMHLKPGAHPNECPLCGDILKEDENPSFINGQPWHYEE